MHYGPPADDVKLRLVPYHYQANGFKAFSFAWRRQKSKGISGCARANYTPTIFDFSSKTLHSKAIASCISPIFVCHSTACIRTQVSSTPKAPMDMDGVSPSYFHSLNQESNQLLLLGKGQTRNARHTGGQQGFPGFTKSAPACFLPLELQFRSLQFLFQSGDLALGSFDQIVQQRGAKGAGAVEHLDHLRFSGLPLPPPLGPTLGQAADNGIVRCFHLGAGP